MPETGSPWSDLGPMDKAYDFHAVESPVYQYWMNRGFFKPSDDANAQTFSIVMPPPNVTGSLHLGHALESAIQDALVRWKRMQGFSVLWVPGTDHAGIATQMLVERDLLQREEIDRHVLGREKFLDRVWQWVHNFGDRITEQRKRLGASCDWDRACFTLDSGPSRAVRRTFVQLYNKGLIYRGTRLVNWCPRDQTALSDLEVVHRERRGSLYRIRYPFVDQEGELVVATTRPETMLGDTAVAVNPNDARYREVVGHQVQLPLTDRTIPVIADENVDPEFGTGALKVTPAHDVADFEIGERHGLEKITVIGKDGRMTEEAGNYAGLTREEAREAVVGALQEQHFLEAVEPYVNQVGECDRCGTVVEPLVSLQWWVAMSKLTGPSIEAVKQGKIRFVPDRFTRVYFNWMENLRDWCVSRQIWWGHRIPVWYCESCGETIVAEEDPTGCPTCGDQTLRQDEDVLDTWFSSGLWPLSTLGWPDEDSPDLKRFYPTSVMECGRDILFLWVSRMITFGLENMNDVPFRVVYLHGLLQDPHGAKMSKTKGNVVDPLELIETYGTDAVRFALTTGVAPGNESRLSPAKMEAGRNFANKLWNAARFVVNAVDSTEGEIDWAAVDHPTHLEDRWIMSRLNHLAASVDRYLDTYQIGEAQRLLYEFAWSEYCDWYLEVAKVRLRAGGSPSVLPYLAAALEATLRLLHPFMPFVTEQIWQHLQASVVRKGHAPLGESIMLAPYPEEREDAYDDQAEADFAVVMDVVRAIRNVRAEMRIQPSETVETVLASPDGVALLDAERPAIETLSRSVVHFVSGGQAALDGEGMTIVLNRATVAVTLPASVEAAEFRSRLLNDLENASAARERLSQRLNNREFLTKAPEDVVDKERARLEETEDRIERLRQLVGVGE